MRFRRRRRGGGVSNRDGVRTGGSTDRNKIAAAKLAAIFIDTLQQCGNKLALFCAQFRSPDTED